MLESLETNRPVGFTRKSSYIHTYILRNHIPKILCRPVLLTGGVYAPDATCIATPLFSSYSWVAILFCGLVLSTVVLPSVKLTYYNRMSMFFCIIHDLLCCFSCDFTDMLSLFRYAVVTCEIKLFQSSSVSVWNNFISARGNFAEIISKLFQNFTAAHEYFPTCSLSLK